MSETCGSMKVVEDMIQKSEVEEG